MCTGSAFDIVKEEGEDMNITCIPNIPVEWKRDGQPGKLFMNGRVIKGNSYLYISNLTTDNSAVYTCHCRDGRILLAEYNVHVRGTFFAIWAVN